MNIKTIAVLGILFLAFSLSACDILTTSTSAATISTTTSTIGTSTDTNSTTTLTTSTSTDTNAITTTTTSTTTDTSGTTTTTTTSVETTFLTFTLAQLSQYNGNGGSTAYIAVLGVVYDVTNAEEWTNGWHKGVHYAETDATAAFEDSPHSLAFISQLPVVGQLVN